MSVTTARIRSTLFGAAVAAALGSGLAAAAAQAPSAEPAARHCYAITDSAARCRNFCTTVPGATGSQWDPATGCCVCTFF